MRSARTAALAAVVAGALAAAPALAKTPSGVRTVEEIRSDAEKADAEAKRREAEAKRDPNREAIEDYRTKKAELKAYMRLVEILLDEKTPELQDYRLPAADALLHRFTLEDPEKDPTVKPTKIAIALALTDLLGRSARDERGLEAAEKIFYGWFRVPLATAYHWKRDQKMSERQAAEKKMEKWLRSEQKNK